MNEVEATLLVAVGGSAPAAAGWDVALRLGAVLVVAVAVVVPLVAKLARAVDAAQSRDLDQLFLLEADDWGDREGDDR